MFTYTLNIIIWSVIFATLFIYLAVLACTFLELMFSLFKVVVYTLSWPTYAGMNPSEPACLSCMSHSTFMCVQACYCSVEVIVALFSHVQDWLLKPHFIPRPFLVFFYLFFLSIGFVSHASCQPC